MRLAIVRTASPIGAEVRAEDLRQAISDEDLAVQDYDLPLRRVMR